LAPDCCKDSPGRPWGGGPLVTEENLEGVNDAPSASRDLRN
jgi:hypothetical protein